MRIAFIGPYQGPELLKNRPCVQNFTLGGKVKMELIAELLRKGSNEVEVLSQGEVDQFAFRYYPSLQEKEPFHKEIPVLYASSLPIRYVNRFWSSYSMVRLFKERHRLRAFELVVVYNMKPGHIACAHYAMQGLGLPVVLEYEDDSFLDSGVSAGNSYRASYHRRACMKLLNSVSGCIANSLTLLSQVPSQVPKLLLCGVVGEVFISAASAANGPRKNWVVFSGTHSKPQGLEQLVTAWKLAGLTGWELHIAGHGEVTATLHKLAEDDLSIVFHGLLSREDNARMLNTGKLAVVPYEASQTSGFSFKTIEYLAAGLHVITTRLRALEALKPELKDGITYLDDNTPGTIAACLKEIIASRQYERTAAQAALDEYGPEAVSRALDDFLGRVMASRSKDNTNL